MFIEMKCSIICEAPQERNIPHLRSGNEMLRGFYKHLAPLERNPNGAKSDRQEEITIRRL